MSAPHPTSGRAPEEGPHAVSEAARMFWRFYAGIVVLILIGSTVAAFAS